MIPRWERAAGAALLAVVAAAPVSAMTIRPMTDAQLVRTSDVIVVGTVTQISSGEWDHRIVTWVDVAIERRIKGRSAGDSIRLTEVGGQAGGRHLVIPGAPRYEPGERVVVFARAWGDRLLRTNSFALGKFAVRESPGGVAEARQAAPAKAARPLASFLDRMQGLADREPGARGEFEAPNGYVDEQVAATVAPFQIGLTNGRGTLFRGRWFESDCGVPVEYVLGNIDPLLGDAATRQVVTEALEAWTAPVTAGIVLTLGADIPAVPADFDGYNTIVFEDPFDEIVDDLSDECTGVLAVGGFYSNPFFGELKVGGRRYDRTVDAFVVMNDRVSACIDQAGIAETLAHEIGHTIGFGHSSEDENEPDPDLEDALMYFLVHDDGRGARLGADDLRGLPQIYPPMTSVDPLTDQLAFYACQYNLGPFGIGCGLDAIAAGDDGVLVPLPPFRRYNKARKLARKAAHARRVKKARKFVRRSRKQAIKSDRKAMRFFDRGRFPPGCFDDIHSANDRAIREADALLLELEANL
jgi:hypothetical protein